MKLTREQLEALVIIQELQAALARQKLKLLDLQGKIDSNPYSNNNEESQLIASGAEELYNIIEDFESRIRASDLNCFNCRIIP
jgi:hypothetical protein